MRIFISFCLLAALTACSSTKQTQSAYQNQPGGSFKITESTTDESYGYSQTNSVKVGGQSQSGPANERRFLNALIGQNGEEIQYKRLGSCCPFKTPNGIIDGQGLLDKYEVTYAGLSKPIIIYINMYDKGEMKAPKGFRFKE